MLFYAISQTLSDLRLLLLQLDYKQYTFRHGVLSGSTIGEHTRHIIELFQCVISHYDEGNINYDNRKRNKIVEVNLQSAIEAIDEIISGMERPDKVLQLHQNLEGIAIQFTTNYYRELLYNLEHSIHHQAIIKVATLDERDVILPDNFGVAPSTVQYRASVK